MSELFFDIHGVGLAVSGEASAVEALSRDLETFRSAPRRVDLRLGLELAPALSRAAWGRAAWRGPGFRVRARGGAREILYEDGARARWDAARAEAWVAAPGAERLHELGYLAALSRAGEALDRRGLHRVHALGFSAGGETGLVLLPSGGGKSVLALGLLRSTALGILSDETPLVDAAGRAHPFPVRWSFRPSADLSGVPECQLRPFRRLRFGPKRLLDCAAARGRVGASGPVRWLLLGRRHGGSPRLEAASRGEAFAALLGPLVAGLGVAQMAEYMLRLDPRGVAGLAGIALGRARAAWVLAASARSYRLVLGPEPEANARLLEELARS